VPIDLSKNALFINFKNYDESTRTNALPLAQLAKKVAEKEGKQIVLVINPVEIALTVSGIGKEVSVFAQHIDPDVFGKGTGKVLPEVVKHYGASGTVLNHAEYKLTKELLEKSIERAKNCGLLVMVCAETIERAKEIASMKIKPDLIAVEPPELIGGNVSVSTANPEIISGTVKAIKEMAPEIIVICGAGIKNKNDVAKAIELGSKGVFVASGIIKAIDKEKAITEMVIWL
jgi:triosephosphate isomerase